MKNTILLLLIFISIPTFAQILPEDTTFVQTHSSEHWSWYGSIDKWSVFPDTNKRYRRILMEYTLGCPSSGCSQWDYTTKIEVLHRTGLTDSSLTPKPSFTVDSLVTDTFNFNTGVTYSYFYNSTSMTTDSTANTSMEVVVFGDSLNPLDTTSAFLAYPVNYWNYLYDNTGAITDSVWVGADSTWVVVMYPYYVYFPQVVPVELGRLMTPYAGSMSASWKNSYIFDVTDYAAILRDSVEIRAFYDGWSDGFTISLKFMLIEGVPPRDVISVKNLYHGYFPFGSATNSIENYLVPKTVSIASSANNSMVRIITSGHGFNDSQYCAEFCPKYYRIKVDGTQRYQQTVWRNDCGLNPIYPQNGTWIYDRAGWCPGSKTISYDHEITPFVSPGSNAIIDMDMEAYIANTGGATYIIDGQFFEFTAPNFAVDAALEDILAPNSRFDQNRINPVCSNPRVVIKNTGAAPLTNLVIKYGCVGNALLSYNWTGNLGFMQTEEVTLPNASGSFWTGNQFISYVTNPNGAADIQPYNDTLRSNFNNPPVYGLGVVLTVKTNNYGNETSYGLLDGNENVIFQKNNLGNNIIYRDTILLTAGCYKFVLDDDGCDGLSWWANSAQGTGYARINKLSPTNSSYKTFGSDFGCQIHHYFNAESALSVDESVEPGPFFNVYPNPSTGEFVFETGEEINQEVFLDIFNIVGHRVFTSVINQENNSFRLNLSGFSPGVYYTTIRYGSNVEIKKLVLSK